MYIFTIIEEVGNIHEVINKGIANINSPSALLTIDHKLDPAELAGGEETQTKTLL